MKRSTNKLTKRLTAGLLAVFLVFTSLDLTAIAEESPVNAEESIVYDVSGNETVSEITEDISENDSYVEEPSDLTDEETTEETSEDTSGNDEFDENDLLDIADEYSELNEKFFSSGMGGGYVASKFDTDVPAVKSKNTANTVKASTLPAKYYSTIEELKENLPGTRDQNPYGTCWAHAATACAELSLLKQGKADKSIDFSELETAFYAFYSKSDPMGGTSNDTSRPDSHLESGTDWLDTGYNMMGAFYGMAQWLGMANESDVPYSGALNAVKNKKVRGSYVFSNAAAHVSGMRIINIHEDEDIVKQTIMNNGAVGISYLAADFYNPRYNTYFFPVSGYGVNHAVTIVGWDDTVPASYFEVTYSYSGDDTEYTARPERDGGWIVRNSWTTSTGANVLSYFIMSYCDKSLDDAAYAFYTDEADKYDNIYQYDGGRWSYPSGYKKVANVFEVRGAEGSETEELDAVSFLATCYTDISYTVQIYKNVADVPTSGTLVSAATTTGTTSTEGYYTVELKTPVQLKRGSKFAVVITTVGSGTVDQERDDEWTGMIVSYTGANAGESYYYSGSSWQTIIKNNPNLSSGSSNSYGGNLCIKAFTKNTESIPSGKYRVIFDGNGNTSGRTDFQDFEVGKSASLKSNGFARKGYFFAGWNTTSDGTGTSYSENQLVSNL